MIDQPTHQPEAPHPCPICGKAQKGTYAPFCSARCQKVDLNRWFSGLYAIPAVEAAEPDEDDGEA